MKINALDSRFIKARGESSHLMIVLHGRGDSYEGFLWLPETLGLDMNYLLLNAPDDYYGGFSWYDLEPNQLPGVIRSRGLLDQTLEEVLNNGYKPENIILFGFSQGSLIGFEWGGRINVPLAGILSISGYILDPELLLKEATEVGRDIPRFVSHGINDMVLPYARSKDQIIQVQEGGFHIDFHTYNKDHTIDQFQEITDIRSFISQIISPKHFQES